MQNCYIITKVEYRCNFNFDAPKAFLTSKDSENLKGNSPQYKNNNFNNTFEFNNFKYFPLQKKLLKSDIIPSQTQKYDFNKFKQFDYNNYSYPDFKTSNRSTNFQSICTLNQENKKTPDYTSLPSFVSNYRKINNEFINDYNQQNNNKYQNEEIDYYKDPKYNQNISNFKNNEEYIKMQQQNDINNDKIFSNDNKNYKNITDFKFNNDYKNSKNYKYSNNQNNKNFNNNEEDENMIGEEDCLLCPSCLKKVVENNNIGLYGLVKYPTFDDDHIHNDDNCNCENNNIEINNPYDKIFNENNNNEKINNEVFDNIIGKKDLKDDEYKNENNNKIDMENQTNNKEKELNELYGIDIENTEKYPDELNTEVIHENNDNNENLEKNENNENYENKENNVIENQNLNYNVNTDINENLDDNNQNLYNDENDNDKNENLNKNEKSDNDDIKMKHSNLDENENTNNYENVNNYQEINNNNYDENLINYQNEMEYQNICDNQKKDNYENIEENDQENYQNELDHSQNDNSKLPNFNENNNNNHSQNYDDQYNINENHDIFNNNENNEFNQNIIQINLEKNSNIFLNENNIENYNSALNKSENILEKNNNNELYIGFNANTNPQIRKTTEPTPTNKHYFLNLKPNFIKCRHTENFYGNNIITKEEELEERFDSFKNENISPMDEYSEYIFNVINAIRTNPPYFADIIKNSMNKICVTKNGKTLYYKGKQKIGLYKGKKAFENAIYELNNTKPMNELFYCPNISIPIPNNEYDIIDKNYLNKKIAEITDSGIKIISYWKNVVESPEDCLIMMIVDDNSNEGLKRKDILDPKMKYIGISTVKIGRSFANYITLSDKKDKNE